MSAQCSLRWESLILHNESWLTTLLVYCSAAHVRSGRRGRERLERKHKVQERLLLKPRCYSVVLEGSFSFIKPTRFLFLSYNFLFFQPYFHFYFCRRRLCCWWMQKSESDSCSLWPEHLESQWMALPNSTVRFLWQLKMSYAAHLPQSYKGDLVFWLYSLCLPVSEWKCIVRRIFSPLSAACSCEFTGFLLRVSHHTIIFYVFDGYFFFQGLTDHSCSPLSNGEHVINSPEPTHGKHLPEIVLVITQCCLVLKLCPSLLIVHRQMKGPKLSLAPSVESVVCLSFAELA